MISISPTSTPPTVTPSRGACEPASSGAAGLLPATRSAAPSPTRPGTAALVCRSTGGEGGAATTLAAPSRDHFAGVTVHRTVKVRTGTLAGLTMAEVVRQIAGGGV